MLKKRHLHRLRKHGFFNWNPTAAASAVVAVNGGTMQSNDPNILTQCHSCTVPQTVITYHNVDQVGDGVDKRPDPLAVSLRVDGAGRRADGRTPQALLGVHLHKIKGPKQMLWAATLWEEGVPLEQLPYFFDDEHVCPEKFQKVSCLCRCRADTVRRPVLYVPGHTG